MPAWILTLLGWLGGFVIKLLTRSSPVVQEAEKAGAAQAQLKDVEAADNNVQKAVEASDSAAQSVSTDAGLRAYERTDPNNRDNAQ